MTRPARVVFDTDDVVGTRFDSHEVDQTDTLLMSSSTKTNSDSSVTVSTSFSSKGNGELAERSALVEVWG